MNTARVPASVEATKGTAGALALDVNGATSLAIRGSIWEFVRSSDKGGEWLHELCEWFGNGLTRAEIRLAVDELAAMDELTVSPGDMGVYLSYEGTNKDPFGGYVVTKFTLNPPAPARIGARGAR